MCGLAGILSLDGVPVRHAALRSMTEALRHRGPDEGAAILLADPDGGAARSTARCGLGHRRLRVVDLSAAAAQPMRSARGCWMVYNGELYNTAELRADLAAAGVRFRSRSDTEVVLEALCAWGTDALPRLEGMFALAFWDPRMRRLILARDRFGEKPLYYAVLPGAVAFASELGALLRHGAIPAEIDPEGVELYLTLGYVPAPWTIYRGVRKLPHASCLEFAGAGAPRLTRWYRLEERIPAAAESPEREVRHRLEDSVRRRLEADVPLGAFLSGGIDSAAVVACMRLARGAAPRTYSMSLPGWPHFDESRRAGRSAAHFRTLHSEIPIDAERLIREIPFLLGRLDEPFADSSALAVSVVAREARRDLTVALSGDGADEVFGGYRIFRALAAHRVLARLPARAVGALATLLSVLPARQGSGMPGVVRQTSRLLQGFGSDLASAHLAWMSVCDAAERRALRPAVPDADLARGLVEERYRRFGDGLEGARGVEIDLALPDDMLAKVDRTSMLHALEVRAPFLAHGLVETALGLKAPRHFGPFGSKRLLRKALAGLVPDEILRGPKRGFEVPVGDWLTGALEPVVRDVVTKKALEEGAGLDGRVVAGWFEEHRTRRRDRGRALWALFAFCFWMQGPRRAHGTLPARGTSQLREVSSSDATALRSSEG